MSQRDCQNRHEKSTAVVINTLLMPPRRHLGQREEKEEWRWRTARTIIAFWAHHV
jgi:hypothetical protein